MYAQYVKEEYPRCCPVYPTCPSVNPLSVDTERPVNKFIRRAEREAEKELLPFHVKGVKLPDGSKGIFLFQTKEQNVLSGIAGMLSGLANVIFSFNFIKDIKDLGEITTKERQIRKFVKQDLPKYQRAHPESHSRVQTLRKVASAWQRVLAGKRVYHWISGITKAMTAAAVGIACVGALFGTLTCIGIVGALLIPLAVRLVVAIPSATARLTVGGAAKFAADKHARKMLEEIDNLDKIVPFPNVYYQ